MKIAALQLRSSRDVASNIAAASDGIREAVSLGAEFVATPEMTNILTQDREELAASVSNEESDPTLRAMRELARAHQIAILIGSLAVKVGGGIHNRSFLLNRSGDVIARYSKIHMFDADVGKGDTWRESQTYTAGQTPVMAHVGDWHVGLSICYDLRFPDLYRYYGRMGCGLLTVPSAFTVPTGKAHWDILLRARAIENGAFVIAPAQGGTHEDGRSTYGHSRIIAPWGERVASLDHDEAGVCLAEIDPERVRTARERILAWKQAPRF